MLCATHMGFSIKCQGHVVTVDHQQRDKMSLFRGHSPQRAITSTRQSETKYQLLLQFFSGANRVLSSSKGDGKTTRSQEGATQSCSRKNMPCRNAPELLIQCTVWVPVSQLPSAHLCTLRSCGKKRPPDSRHHERHSAG